MGNLPINGNLPILSKGIPNIGWSDSQYRLQNLPVVGIATVFTLSSIVCTYNHITVYFDGYYCTDNPAKHGMLLPNIYQVPGVWQYLWFKDTESASNILQPDLITTRKVKCILSGSDTVRCWCLIELQENTHGVCTLLLLVLWLLLFSW